MAVRTTILTAFSVSLLALMPTAPSARGQETSFDFSLTHQSDVAVDGQGNILVSESDAHRVLKITPDGEVSIFAGTGRPREPGGQAANGVPATEADLRRPLGLAVGSHNEVYITDWFLVHRVDSNGIITTVFDDGPWDDRLEEIGLDPGSGKIYIAQENDRIWRVENGRFFRHAGSGEEGCKGDGGPPTEAQFIGIDDMTVGPDGALYLPDGYFDYRIRRIDPSGSTITTVVGNGRHRDGRIPDGTPALRTGLGEVPALAFDSQGRLHFLNDSVVYRLEPEGSISLFSALPDLLGGGVRGEMAFDLSGKLIIADQAGPRILEVSADGSRVRTIVSGSGSSESASISSLLSAASPNRSQDGTTLRDRHRIIGGEEVGPEEWPFVARIDDPRGLCTASLVAPNWLLTAAHCLVDHDGSVTDPSELSVFLGHDWDTGVCENTRDEIGRVIVHPDYYFKGAGFRNDVALVEILEPAPATPIRILTPEEEAWHAPSGSAATTVGWGRRDDGSYPRILHDVDIPLWTPEDCLRDSLWKNSEIVHERTLCAGAEGMGTDPGDSGGPLLVALPDDGWGQLGITSLGRRGAAKNEECDAGCPTLAPGERDSGQDQPGICAGEKGFGQQSLCRLRGDQRRRQARGAER